VRTICFVVTLPTSMTVEYVPDCVPYETMYPAMFGSLFAFHVAVTVAALTSGVHQKNSPMTANARRVCTLRFLTREAPHSESVSIMQLTIV
jgi:hypothetical protein